MAARSSRRSATACMLTLWVRSRRGHECLSGVSVVCSQVEVSGRADHSSRGVLQTAVRRCVWSRNLMNEATSRVGPQRHKKIPLNMNLFKFNIIHFPRNYCILHTQHLLLTCCTAFLFVINYCPDMFRPQFSLDSWRWPRSVAETCRSNNS